MAEGKIPDALGERQRAALVAAQLASLQQEAFQLELQRSAGNLDGGAPVPGQTKDDGTPMTFDERAKQLEESQRRLVADHGSPELEQLAKARATGNVGV